MRPYVLHDIKRKWRKNAVFWDITPCEALEGATWRNIPEDDILHSHRRENLKSPIALTGWDL
jgi:hypothetical protein